MQGAQGQGEATLLSADVLNFCSTLRSPTMQFAGRQKPLAGAHPVAALMKKKDIS